MTWYPVSREKLVVIFPNLILSLDIKKNEIKNMENLFFYLLVLFFWESNGWEWGLSNFFYFSYPSPTKHFKFAIIWKPGFSKLGVLSTISSVVCSYLLALIVTAMILRDLSVAFSTGETHGSQWAWKDMSGSCMGLRNVPRMILNVRWFPWELILWDRGKPENWY